MKPSHNNEHVLVVEDDPAISTALRLRLMSKGLSVTVVSDGAAAVKVGAEVVPDALLLDINLPSLDGFEVASELRSELGDVPIIFMTALRNTHHRTSAELMENTWYIEKPFTTPFLIHTIQQAVQQPTV